MEFYKVTFNDFGFYGKGGEVECSRNIKLQFCVAKVGNEYIDLVTHDIIEDKNGLHTGKTDLFFLGIKEIEPTRVVIQMRMINDYENLKQHYINELNSFRKPELKIDDVSYLENNVIAPLSSLNESKEEAPSRQYLLAKYYVNDDMNAINEDDCDFYDEEDEDDCDFYDDEDDDFYVLGEEDIKETKTENFYIAYEEDGVIREFLTDYLLIPIDANAYPSESYLTYDSIERANIFQILEQVKSLENESNLNIYLNSIKDSAVLGEEDAEEYILSFKKQKSNDINNIMRRN